MRKFWLIIIIIGIGLFFNNINSSYAQAAIPTNLELEIHISINEERLRTVPNYPQLKFHSTLIEIARTYSKYMYDENHFDHYDKSGNGPADRVETRGITYSLVAENLYWSQNILENQIANSAVNGWINSPGHYSNMKSLTSYTGIGVYSQNNIYYITQLFVEASELDMLSVGVIYDNENLDPIKEPSVFEKYKQEIFVFGLILTVVLLGKKAESLNRGRYRR